jgi:hypothetical protein
MGGTVDTSYLRGYADQLEANRTGALARLTTYTGEHCQNFDGVEGSLYPARWPLQFAADRLRDALADATMGMGSCAKELRYRSDSYDKSDKQGEDVASGGGFTGGADVHLAAPKNRKDADEAKNAVYELLGTINKCVQKVTGYDLLGAVLPLVFGDWGALRRIADAWNELEQGCMALGGDLEAGMNTLSEHWDSTADGSAGASRAFDHHIRERWVPACEALAQACRTVQQASEQLAAFYEQVVRQVLFILNFYAKRITKAITGLLAAADIKKCLWELYQLVSSVTQLVTDAIEIIWLELKTFKEGFETLWAGLAHLRNLMRGDFDALTA